MPTFWITKYALTKGVYSFEAAEPVGILSLMQHPSYRHTYFHGEGRDWHRTESAAKECAAAMKAKKIASLKKQIAKLENLTF